MAPPLFLLDPAGTATSEEEVVLSGPEGRHAAASARLRVGEEIDLADGLGTRLRGVVAHVAADRSGLVVRVRERWTEPEPRPRITVVQALPKGERAELAVAAMTEAGVDRIVPWEARHCVARWKGDRAGKHLRRWRDTAREAAKQARRARVPEVTDLAHSPDVAKRLADSDLGVVLDHDAPDRLATLPLPEDGDITLVVGPEGGLATSELELFAASARPVMLGSTVLRTSTAGVVAVAVLQARTGRW